MILECGFPSARLALICLPERGVSGAHVVSLLPARHLLCLGKFDTVGAITASSELPEPYCLGAGLYGPRVQPKASKYLHMDFLFVRVRECDVCCASTVMSEMSQFHTWPPEKLSERQPHRVLRR